jgi:hypothetical protein
MDYISTKISMDNYDGLANLMKHVQNMCSSLDLVIQHNNVICKIFLTTFRGSARICYNNLDLGSIEKFSDLFSKLVAHFNTTILAKRIFIELFRVTQLESESTRVYLKRFKENMLKFENFLELVTLETLINKVRECFL